MNNQKNCAKESPTVFQENFVLFFLFGAIFQLLVVAIFWCGRHFSASGLSNFWRFFGGFVFAIFQLLVLAIFGAGAIFQLLVLAIFGNFLEDLFLQH